MDIAAYQYPSSCAQKSLSFLYSPSPHLLSFCFSSANLRNITVTCTELDSVSKVELFSVSLAVSLSTLQIEWGTIIVQEVLEDVLDYNFDAKLFFPDLLHAKIPRDCRYHDLQ